MSSSKTAFGDFRDDQAEAKVAEVIQKLVQYPGGTFTQESAPVSVDTACPLLGSPEHELLCETVFMEDALGTIDALLRASRLIVADVKRNGKQASCGMFACTFRLDDGGDVEYEWSYVDPTATCDGRLWDYDTQHQSVLREVGVLHFPVNPNGYGAAFGDPFRACQACLTTANMLVPGMEILLAVAKRPVTMLFFDGNPTVQPADSKPSGASLVEHRHQSDAQSVDRCGRSPQTRSGTFLPFMVLYSI
jgi:hypothetical protein